MKTIRNKIKRAFIILRYSNYINDKRLNSILGNDFDLIKTIKYTEFDENDSIVLIAKVRK